MGRRPIDQAQLVDGEARVEGEAEKVERDRRGDGVDCDRDRADRQNKAERDLLPATQDPIRRLLGRAVQQLGGRNLEVPLPVHAMAELVEDAARSDHDRRPQRGVQAHLAGRLGGQGVFRCHHQRVFPHTQGYEAMTPGDALGQQVSRTLIGGDLGPREQGQVELRRDRGREPEVVDRSVVQHHLSETRTAAPLRLQGSLELVRGHELPLEQDVADPTGSGRDRYSGRRRRRCGAVRRRQEVPHGRAQERGERHASSFLEPRRRRSRRPGTCRNTPARKHTSAIAKIATGANTHAPKNRTKTPTQSSAWTTASNRLPSVIGSCASAPMVHHSSRATEVRPGVAVPTRPCRFLTM